MIRCRFDAVRERVGIYTNGFREFAPCSSFCLKSRLWFCVTYFVQFYKTMRFLRLDWLKNEYWLICLKYRLIGILSMESNVEQKWCECYAQLRYILVSSFANYSSIRVYFSLCWSAIAISKGGRHLSTDSNKVDEPFKVEEAETVNIPPPLTDKVRYNDNHVWILTFVLIYVCTIINITI